MDITCVWFALCDRPAVGLSRGPIGGGAFGMVPVCHRCAERLDLPLSPLFDEED